MRETERGRRAAKRAEAEKSSEEIIRLIKTRPVSGAEKRVVFGLWSAKMFLLFCRLLEKRIYYY
jgi:hypothetical protein